MLDNKVINDALNFIAQKEWKLSSDDFFIALVNYLGETFNLDYVILDKLVDNYTAETIALYAHGDIIPNLRYELKDTPCDNVASKKLCYYPSNVQEMFPKDKLLVEMGVNAYIGIPLWDSQGGAIGLLVAMNGQEICNPDDLKMVLKVVSARAGAELERKKYQDYLKEQKEYYRVLFENAPQPKVLVSADDGRILMCNEKFSNLVGFSHNEIVGQHHSFFCADNHSKENTFESFFAHKSGFNGIPIEYKVKNKDGRVLDVKVVSSQVKWCEKEAFLGFFEDVTEQKKLYEERQRSAQLAALGTVAAGVAHEINNPIQGILNFAELLKLKPEAVEQVKDIAERIDYEGERIAKITGDLLSYAKDSRDEMIFSDMNNLILSATGLIKTKVRHKGINISFDLSDSLSPVLVQPQSFQQIIINLIDNAYDALRCKKDAPDRKMIKIKTSTSEKAEKDFLRVEVDDNGIGMTTDVLEKAQTAFFTTKPSSEGTGLGLSIVADIVKKHDGFMEILSTVGQGTSVGIYIPLKSNA